MNLAFHLRFERKAALHSPVASNPTINRSNFLKEQMRFAAPQILAAESTQGVKSAGVYSSRGTVLAVGNGDRIR